MNLTPIDVAALAADGHVESIARRDVLPLDGATIAVVMDGYFRVFRNAAFVRDVTLGLATAGDVLAPAVAFGDQAAESGAEALTAGRVVLMSPDAWDRHAAADPSLYLKFAASVGRRLARLQQKLEQVSRSSVQARVAATLVELAAEHGTRLPNGDIRLDVPLSQEDLGRLAGTTRESASSAIAGFVRAGLVRGGRVRGLVVCAGDGLLAV